MYSVPSVGSGVGCLFCECLVSTGTFCIVHNCVGGLYGWGVFVAVGCASREGVRVMISLLGTRNVGQIITSPKTASCVVGTALRRSP